MAHFKKYTILLAAIIFTGCAQIGSLSGGEKDKEPPKYVKSTPKEQGRNFNDDKISITFDEFFTLDNLSSVFLASPPLSEKPDFKIKRKSLVIRLHENLKDTTTYTFLFGNAIKDYHEGNKIDDFRFVFSTGEDLDTLEASGRIIDAKTHKGQEGLLVMLYNNYNDSTPIKDKPYYIAKTDTSGKFNINYIKSGKYRIFALKDNDANLNFNLPSEKIAYTNSFVIPTVKTETKIDSFKAGSVLHIGKTDTIGDTLRNDTVIVSKKYIYAPKDILLFSFVEDYQNQYLAGTERNLKGKCVFQYSKDTRNLKVNGMDIDLNPTNSFIERQDSGRSVVLWLKDKDIFQKDTLKFSTSYFNKDSLGNPVNEHDTVVFTFNFEKDTLKNNVEFAEGKTDIDYFKDFDIETETPLSIKDTSKIKLFILYDTLVTDTKKQELIKHYRPAPDTLIFSLKRPFVKTFSIKALNFDSVNNENFKLNTVHDTLMTFKITNPEISQKDTLKLILHYDNAYFKGQIQNFSDTLELPLFKQKLISAERPSQDTLILNFTKRVSTETTINLTNQDVSNWYTKILSDNDKQFKLKIKNRDLIEEDTLMLEIRTLDYDNTQGDKIYFEYLKNVIFKHKRQKINLAMRPQKSEITLIFNKALQDDIKIKSLDSLAMFNSFKINYNKTKDTAFCKILDPNLINKDTVSVTVEYYEKIKHKKIEHSDTLTLIYKKKRHKHTRHYQGSSKDTKKESTQTTAKNENKETVSIEIPVTYEIKNDSLNQRIFHIAHPWKQGASYVLKTDSFALEDYYGNFSKQKEFKFKVRTEDDYGKIILNISNIKKISDEDFYSVADTISVDSVEYSTLPGGQLILNMYDKDNNLLKTEYLKKDTILNYENIISGNYHIELIYDKNNNKIWDTGNYLKNIQPERIIYYPDEIIVKPNWDNSVDIKIKAQKYN